MPPGDVAADRVRIASIDAQTLDIQHTLAESWSDITDGSDLATLWFEKMVVEERLDSYKYPVLTLPSEIVSEIFIHFLPTFPYRPPIAGKHSPTSLTQICRRWRGIALATPELWRAIELSAEDHPFLQLYTVFVIWLDRSHSLPLSISIRETPDDYDNSVLPGIFAALVQNRGRLEWLELRLIQSRLPDLDGPMPLLRRLSLSAVDTSSSFSLHSLPLLRSADLGDVTTRSVTLPWAQLTSLSLRHVHPDDSARILRQTAKLVHCTIQLWFNINNNQFEVTLPYLESLVFDATSDAVPGYLGQFNVPALRILEVPSRQLGFAPIDSLAELISKSGCNLQEVRILDGKKYIPEDVYRDTFRDIPRFSVT
ncbi:hypothetical protein DFH06DRAFT_1325231 [Mycena polygramma]|nr:hypothetical protein DFH06DRAFT_1325231 [Mycena polygramma]